MFDNPKIWMERTHSRKGKCKTEFKGVVNKVLVTTLILTTVLSTTLRQISTKICRGSFCPVR